MPHQRFCALGVTRGQLSVSRPVWLEATNAILLGPSGGAETHLCVRVLCKTITPLILALDSHATAQKSKVFVVTVFS